MQVRGSKQAMNESLTEFVNAKQQLFYSATSLVERKQRGHFGTPSEIARFMAEMFSEKCSQTLRILDPGAGVGMLSVALCQRILSQNKSRKIYFELWENDPTLIPLLKDSMLHSQNRLNEAGLEMDFDIRDEDFILANSPKNLFEIGLNASFDFAIINPPYFKLRKESPQARAMKHIVHGQPNIYALFMALAADLLVSGGEMVAITPRSYFNGPYFKRFRKWFFERMSPRQIHIFESRKEAFSENSVLQENVILRAVKSNEPSDVILTTTVGRELSNPVRQIVSHHQILDKSNRDQIVRIPSNQFEQAVMEVMDDLPNRFRDLRYKISTGPVVAFRSTEFLRHERTTETAPLLWMHNIRPFITRFPAQNGKPFHIQVNEASRKLLVPAKTYILLKRFTAKEEKRRLVAGIMKSTDSYSEWVGLENHLNYVYRSESELTLEEAYGLAAFFNSGLVDRYFRAISGNTQVNASEIRGMPIPDAEVLKNIGEQMLLAESQDRTTVETVVGHGLKLPNRLIDQLIEVSA
jgi:adenine-specific DNA-methyltransferase